LLVDKPVGISSFGVVAQIRHRIREKTGQKVKIGHTGTLDPAASGLIILVVGSYTKQASRFSKLDKTYKAELTLGKTSTTGDSEGEITERSDKKPSLDDIRVVLASFTGEIEQTPHKFSAIKIDGQRAYKLARVGREVVMKSRRVVIYEIKDVSYNYPKLSFTARVSSGTYIRSLAEDIGEKLGTAAYLSGLRRTKVGDFDVGQAEYPGSQNIFSNLKE